ncbi:MAG: 7-cyano-7-deazaguanine synthase [Planctomycetes bacterium]|nr:7-cyano-7-deazaguanine synthase [Planctomycetota bacterium]
MARHRGARQRWPDQPPSRADQPGNRRSRRLHRRTWHSRDHRAERPVDRFAAGDLRRRALGAARDDRSDRAHRDGSGRSALARAACRSRRRQRHGERAVAGPRRRGGHRPAGRHLEHPGGEPAVHRVCRTERLPAQRGAARGRQLRPLGDAVVHGAVAVARAIALLSGGLDSGVAAALFLAAPDSTLALALFCDYGQRAAVPEARASAALARRLGIAWQRLELPWLGELSRAAGSALNDPARALPQGTAARPGDQASARAVWVPARNAVFVSAAAAFAEVHAADTVVAGFNREEAVTFPDNSAEFVSAGSAFLALGTAAGVQLASPTLALDKDEIVAAARRLGYGPADFWSCYDAGERPCGVCESCARSRW